MFALYTYVEGNATPYYALYSLNENWKEVVAEGDEWTYKNALKETCGPDGYYIIKIIGSEGLVPSRIYT